MNKSSLLSSDCKGLQTFIQITTSRIIKITYKNKKSIKRIKSISFYMVKIHYCIYSKIDYLNFKVFYIASKIKITKDGYG